MNSVGLPAHMTERECRTLCRYVVGREPNRYVLQKYAAGNDALGLDRITDDGFDRLLMGAARRNSLLARLADTYARFARPRSALRAKLQLLLAILETSPPYDQQFKTVNGRRPVVALLVLAGHGVAFAVTLLLAVVTFLPLQVAASMRGRSRAETLAASSLLRQP